MLENLLVEVALVEYLDCVILPRRDSVEVRSQWSLSIFSTQHASERIQKPLWVSALPCYQYTAL